MENVPCAVRDATISSSESRKLRASALKVLERTLDEIARNDQIMSGGEKVFRGPEPEQLCAMSANSLQGLGGGSHLDVGVGTVVKSLVVHAHLPRPMSCLCHFSDC